MGHGVCKFENYLTLIRLLSNFREASAYTHLGVFRK